MNKAQNNLASVEDHLERQYGKCGTTLREELAEGFEIFRLGGLFRELRKEKGLTQKELALKCGSTKKFISKIENNAGDVRLSKLMRIIRVGFDGQLNCIVDFNPSTIQPISKK